MYGLNHITKSYEFDVNMHGLHHVTKYKEITAGLHFIILLIKKNNYTVRYIDSKYKFTKTEKKKETDL